MPQLTGLHVYPVKSTYRLSPDSARVEPWGLAGDRRWMLVDPTGRFVSQRERPELGQLRTLPAEDGTLTLRTPDGAGVEVPPPSAARQDRLAEVEVWGTRFRAAEADDKTQAWIAENIGDFRLVHLDDPRRRPVDPEWAGPGETVSMADGFPLLLTATASLARLNELIAAENPEDGGQQLPMTRFRPNLVVDGTEAWEEDTWRRIRIGELTFKVVKPCGRCVVTTTDQETGVRTGKEPLRTLARHNRLLQKASFGQNLIPERPEGVRGDVLGTLRLGDPVTVLETGPRWPAGALT
ncbi:molybdenum cofactor biosysynthesis protein [Kitasatospora indigofera]|uniref:Molybdenum cofactor biosysynthesis protein n=1 Tax=Kitasatospora indigofera TaxID=67307 RepID=A0A919G0G7_9ACTN|nr:MOSC N-terminal beta barrel domain-containing protein [Kitasatospora indigofera]GHH75333.1 molybdenum cofactor biosysynthesis protein [Kitasatospora indigofera]